MIKKIILITALLTHGLTSQVIAKDICPGVTYAKLAIKNPCPGIVHIVTADPKKTDLLLSKSGNSCPSQSTVCSMVQEHNAVVGINGGFHTADGTPNGIVKIEKHWYADQTKKRAAIGWCKEITCFLFDIIDTHRTLSINGENLMVNAVNKPRAKTHAIVYTPAFGKTTETDSSGLEVIVANGRIAALSDGGNSPIPSNGFVYSIGNQCTSPLPIVSVGAPATFAITIDPSTTSAEKWNACDYILGGTPLLIQKSKRITDFSPEKTFKNFLTDKFARTAVGITNKGKLLFVVVENIDMDGNDGMTMEELAKLMELLHCTDALCLAGGHSSTLAIQKDMQNNPHGEWSFFGTINWEKEVSNALLLKEKNKATT